MSTRKLCRDCGIATRSRNGLCYECTRHPVARGLPPGRWVGGMVKRFVPDEPMWVSRAPEPLGVLCHCGCLLVNVHESCPACLVWAEKDAKLHAEAQQSWFNRGLVWDVLELRKEWTAA